MESKAATDAWWEEHRWWVAITIFIGVLIYGAIGEHNLLTDGTFLAAASFVFMLVNKIKKRHWQEAMDNFNERYPRLKD